MSEASSKAKEAMRDTKNLMYMFGMFSPKAIEDTNRKTKTSSKIKSENRYVEGKKKGDTDSEQMSQLICKVKKDFLTVEESSDDTSDDSSSASDSSEPEDKPKKTKNNKIMEKHESSKGDIEFLCEVLGKLDNRKTLALDKFDDKSGETIEEYLTRFEQHCRDNIRNDMSYWPEELKAHLQGDLLKAYESLRERKDSYHVVKDKLVKYDRLMAKSRKQRAKKHFRNIKRNPNESLFLFSTRVEKEYKVAYRSSKNKNDKKLVNKFLEKCPKSFQKKIDMIKFTTKSEGKKLNWKKIQAYASVEDETRKKSDTEEEESEEEIIINVQTPQEAQRKDGTQQSNLPIQNRQNQFPSRSFRGSNWTRGNYPQPSRPRLPFQQRESNPQRGGSYWRDNGRKEEGEKQKEKQQDGFNHDSPQSRNFRGFHPRNFRQHIPVRFQARPRAEWNQGQRPRFRQPNQSIFRTRPMLNEIIRCNYCGKMGHYDIQCRLSMQCNHCSKRGHTEETCWFKSSTQNNSRPDQQAQKSEDRTRDSEGSLNM